MLILQAQQQPPQPGVSRADGAPPPVVPKWVEVAKNRYAGKLGSVMMAFNDQTCRYYELAGSEGGGELQQQQGSR